MAGNVPVRLFHYDSLSCIIIETPLQGDKSLFIFLFFLCCREAESTALLTGDLHLAFQVPAKTEEK